MPDHVFAYGSLTAEATGAPAVLRGHRRAWGVAMDNLETIAGYKLYRAADGSRPDVCVAFLDLEPDEGGRVDGVLLAVDGEALMALDARERNYERVDVTALVEPSPGRVWTYAGRPEARERLRRARAADRAVVTTAYLRGVARWGLDPRLPVLDLERIDLPRR